MSAYSASVRFPSIGDAEETLDDLQVVQEEYRHDIAIYTVPRRRKHTLYRTGVPVAITWTRGRDRGSFLGYIHHTEPDSNPGSTKIRVWCRGASQVLDNGVQYSFQNRTVTSVVSDIARRVGFDIEATPHGQVFDSVILNGVLWTELVKHAKEIGYTFYASNTRLQLRPRNELVERHANIAPILQSAVSLYEFAPLNGASPPGQSRTHRTITGVDRRTGGRFQVTGGTAPSRMGPLSYLPTGTRYLEVGSSTPTDARWKLAAMAEMERYNIRATAMGEGHAAVSQTSPVILAGTEDDYLGVWFTHKVTHRMRGADYFMDLELGRDALGQNIEIPDARAKRVLVTRGNPQGRPKVVYPPTILSGGLWQSQWSAASRTFRGA